LKSLIVNNRSTSEILNEDGREGGYKEQLLTDLKGRTITAVEISERAFFEKIGDNYRHGKSIRASREN
jgi:hypothetical protein